MSKLNKIGNKLKFIGLLMAAALLASCASNRQAYWSSAQADYSYGDYGISSTDFYYVGSGYNNWDRGYYGWDRRYVRDGVYRGDRWGRGYHRGGRR